MTYTVSWYDTEKTILRLDIRDKNTWDAWYVAVDEMCNELSTVSHRVDLVVDDQSGMPQGNPLPHLRNTLSKLSKYEHLHTIVTVSEKLLASPVQVMTRLAIRFSSFTIKDLRYEQTFEAGLKVINAQRKGSQAVSA
ncbi:MAG: hypothetical protein KC615_20390 [Anaerolineae bacterium]|nr:hypothetical protein [Anaerolineae bacterium]